MGPLRIGGSLPWPWRSWSSSPSSGRTLPMRSRSVDLDLGAVLRPARVIRAGAVDAVVGVRAEVVAQALDQVGRSAPAAVAVVIGERRGERGHRDSRID